MILILCAFFFLIVGFALCGGCDDGGGVSFSFNVLSQEVSCICCH